MAFDEFGEFFRQMPPALIFNICLVTVGLSALLIYFTLIKPMRARNRRNRDAASGTAAGSTFSPIPQRMVDDLPDLDSLSTVAAVEPRAVPAPAPVTPPPPRRTGEYSVRLNDGQRARAVEVLAILRDTADDRLIVQLENTGYRTLLDQPEIKTRFTTLMKELAETIAKPDTPRPEPENAPEIDLESFRNVDALDEDLEDADLDLPDLDSLSTLPSVSLTPAAPSPSPSPRVTPSVPPGPDGKIPGALPNFREQPTEPKKVVRQGIFRPPKVEFDPVPELNIASAIETYLQHKLQYTPEYEGREIHVHSAPGGGVRIQVDDRYYEAVGDVDDPEIRSFIATSIQEWQQHLQ